MMRPLHFYQILVSLTLTWAEKDKLDLPLCPKYLEYFPQELPMHCRLPRNVDNEAFGLPPDSPFPGYRRQDKQPLPLQIQMPRFPLPGMPNQAFPLPGIPNQAVPVPGMPNQAVPVPGMPGMVGVSDDPSKNRLGMPLPMPMPMPMPMPVSGSPSHKLPVIVMPFYSPDPSSYKKQPHRRHPNKKPHKPHKRPRYHDSSDTDDSDDTDTDSNDSRDGWWKPHKKRDRNKYGVYRRFNKPNNIKKYKKKGELLTPILQYVTKDGYVIFERKISKNEASNWLGPKEESKAKEEINFKKGLEVEDATEEPDEEEVAQEEIPKIKEKKSKIVDVRDVNEMEEIEESQTQYPYRRKNRERAAFGNGSQK